jgi:hypothetical protein
VHARAATHRGAGVVLFQDLESHDFQNPDVQGAGPANSHSVSAANLLFTLLWKGEQHEHFPKKQAFQKHPCRRSCRTGSARTTPSSPGPSGRPSALGPSPMATTSALVAPRAPATPSPPSRGMTP